MDVREKLVGLLQRTNIYEPERNADLILTALGLRYRPEPPTVEEVEEQTERYGRSYWLVKSPNGRIYIVYVAIWSEDTMYVVSHGDTEPVSIKRYAGWLWCPVLMPVEAER